MHHPSPSKPQPPTLQPGTWQARRLDQLLHLDNALSLPPSHKPTRSLTLTHSFTLHQDASPLAIPQGGRAPRHSERRRGGTVHSRQLHATRATPEHPEGGGTVHSIQLCARGRSTKTRARCCSRQLRAARACSRQLWPANRARFSERASALFRRRKVNPKP